MPIGIRKELIGRIAEPGSGGCVFRRNEPSSSAMASAVGPTTALQTRSPIRKEPVLVMFYVGLRNQA